MTQDVDINIEDKQETKKEETIKKVRSFIPKELATYNKDKLKEKGKVGRKAKPKPATQYSLGFPTIEYRINMTVIYKSLGFSDAKSYIMAMIDISENDDNLRKQLIQKAKEIKKN